MNKNAKGAIVVIAVIGIVAGIYQFTHKNKLSYARTITSLNGSTGTVVELLTLDEGYLKAWAKALKEGQASFTYQNSNYNSTGGKAI